MAWSPAGRRHQWACAGWTTSSVANQAAGVGRYSLTRADQRAGTMSPHLARERPTWRHLSECPRCVLYRPNLQRTLTIALIVGTVLFLINHLGTVVSAKATTTLWVETGLSFVVPFCVANVGLLVTCRRPNPEQSVPNSMDVDRVPTWRHLSECPRCIAYRPHLLRTVATALVVGTVYFCVNQLAVVVQGQATTSVWVATGVTYLVPFCVSNLGVLLGTRSQPRLV